MTATWTIAQAAENSVADAFFGRTGGPRNWTIARTQPTTTRNIAKAIVRRRLSFATAGKRASPHRPATHEPITIAVSL
jgi:hypothetical protein